MTSILKVIAILCLLFGVLSASDIYGQDRYPRKVVMITNWHGELFINGRYRDKDQTRLNNVNSKETDLIMEEGVTLNLEGYFYHPNLAEYFASVTLGYTQQRTEVNDTDLDSNGNLLGYNITALIFKEKKISGRIYATKSDHFIDRNFARNINYEEQLFGAEVYTKSDIPMKLTAEYTKSKETSAQRIDKDNTATLDFEASDLRHPDWLTELTYTFRDKDRQLTSISPDGIVGATRQLPDTSHVLNIINTYGLGPGLPGEKRYILSGYLRGRVRSGNFSENFIAASQQFRWQHTKTLFTNYTGIFRYDETDVQKDRYLSGRAGINKQIYASLNIGLSALLTDRKLSTGQQNRYGGTANIQYSKRIPWGIYNNTLTMSLTDQQDKFPQGLVAINNETVTLVGLTYSALSQPNVVNPQDPGSIKVTDLVDVPYIRGADYEVQTIGSITEIKRAVGSSIAPGETVLVDYVVTKSPNARYTTKSIGNLQSFEFATIPLQVYFDYRQVDQEIKAGFDPGNLDKDTRWMIGCDFDMGAFTISAEHEDREQRLSPPFSRERLDIRYNQRVSRDWSITGSGYYGLIQYRQGDEFGLAEGEDFLETYGAHLMLTTKINRSLILHLSGRYSNSKGRIEDELARVGLSGTWSYGRTQLMMSAREEFWKQRDEEGTRLVADFRLTRNF